MLFPFISLDTETITTGIAIAAEMAGDLAERNGNPEQKVDNSGNMVFAAVPGFLVLALMIVQHWLITRSTRQITSFHRTWKHYKIHVQICNTLASFALFGATLLLIVDVVQEKTDSSLITETVFDMLSARGYLTVVLLAFFLAVIKILAERYFEGLLANKDPHLKDPLLNDIWLLWFVVSVIISLPLDQFLAQSMPIDLDPPFQQIVALVIVLTVLLTYVAWIHSVLYRQLTVGEGFGPQIVPPLHGGFSPLADFTPAQSLVIGPEKAGKTCLIEKCDEGYRTKLKRRQQRGDGDVGTQVIEYASLIVTVPVPNENIDLGSTDVKISFSLLDFPGENIGDHCTVPLDLRCDVLVLVMPEVAFDTKIVQRDSLDGLTERELINVFFHLDAEKIMIPSPRKVNNEDQGDESKNVNESNEVTVKSIAHTARDYIYALSFGLNYDGGKNVRISLTGRQRTPVTSFVLVVNQDSDRRRLLAQKEKGFIQAIEDNMDNNAIFQAHIDKLAKLMGRKFGAPEELCFARHVDITKVQQQIFTDALGKVLLDRVRS